MPVERCTALYGLSRAASGAIPAIVPLAMDLPDPEPIVIPVKDSVEAVRLALLRLQARLFEEIEIRRRIQLEVRQLRSEQSRLRAVVQTLTRR